MNKREFLLLSSAAALAGAATGPASACDAASMSAAGLQARRPDLAAAPGLAAWRGYVGEAFLLVGAGTRAELRLAQVQVVSTEGAAEQFTLMFACASPAVPPAGLQTLRHANGQRLAVYLEPTPTGLVAHFNRLG